jgi:hypothetical protein
MNRITPPGKTTLSFPNNKGIRNLILINLLPLGILVLGQILPLIIVEELNQNAVKFSFTFTAVILLVFLFPALISVMSKKISRLDRNGNVVETEWGSEPLDQYTGLVLNQRWIQTLRWSAPVLELHLVNQRARESLETQFPPLREDQSLMMYREYQENNQGKGPLNLPEDSTIRLQSFSSPNAAFKKARETARFLELPLWDMATGTPAIEKFHRRFPWSAAAISLYVFLPLSLWLLSLSPYLDQLINWLKSL